MVSNRKGESKTEMVDLVQNRGNTDYVKSGKVYKNAPMKMVLVSSQSDTSLLTEYEPGTIAYTAGFAQVWQKAPDGSWSVFIGG